MKDDIENFKKEQGGLEKAAQWLQTLPNVDSLKNQGQLSFGHVRLEITAFDALNKLVYHQAVKDLLAEQAFCKDGEQFFLETSRAVATEDCLESGIAKMYAVCP